MEKFEKRKQKKLKEKEKKEKYGKYGNSSHIRNYENKTTYNHNPNKEDNKKEKKINDSKV